jgi:hypothetical protein
MPLAPDPRTPFTVAIMQPYFLPYLGYFRLFAASDLFVVYDCVQFPRRGWVHRNRLVDASGAERWLTLPLQYAEQTALIRDLRFAADASNVFAQRLRPFSLSAVERAAVEPVLETLRNLEGTPVDYIERLLKAVAAYLALPVDTVRSSSLAVPPEFRGEHRILEIARRLGAQRYLNSPGGHDLYNPARFDMAGIELKFLPDYRGPAVSILGRVLSERREDLENEVRSTSATLVNSRRR